MHNNKINLRNTGTESLSRLMVAGFIASIMGVFATVLIVKLFSYLTTSARIEGDLLVEVTRQITFMTTVMTSAIILASDIFKDNKKWISKILKEAFMNYQLKLRQALQSFL